MKGLAWFGPIIFVLVGPAAAEVTLRATVLRADLIAPTTRYGHGALGDDIEWGGMRLTVGSWRTCDAAASCPAQTTVTITLPESRVFEDVEARLFDATGDGVMSVMVVETDLNLGASLALYGASGKKFAATPFIGQPNRWLAPAGAGDFDGDGADEIAYVDRPHLARELVFVRLMQGQLVEVARVPGLTNHRIGDRTIAGGVRHCADGDHVIVASANWTRAVAVGLPGGVVEMTDLGPISGPADLEPFMVCPG